MTRLYTSNSKNVNANIHKNSTIEGGNGDSENDESSSEDDDDDDVPKRYVKSKMNHKIFKI